jgi:hypothetical protein
VPPPAPAIPVPPDPVLFPEFPQALKAKPATAPNTLIQPTRLIIFFFFYTENAGGQRGKIRMIDAPGSAMKATLDLESILPSAAPMPPGACQRAEGSARSRLREAFRWLFCGDE